MVTQNARDSDYIGLGRRFDIIPYVLCLCGLDCVCLDENDGVPTPLI